MLSLSDLIAAGDEIFYIEEPREDLPVTVKIKGRTYTRFLDCIYLPAETHRLTEQQVATVSNIRDRIMRDPLVKGSSNLRVRTHFRAVIERCHPATVLEIGPGIEPLCGPSQSFGLAVAELRSSVVGSLVARGYTAVEFSQSRPLQLPPSSQELIVSVFVFHFRVAGDQINELERVLAPSGAILFNLYRRAAGSRRDLEALFTAADLTVVRITDSEELCRHHEYWIARKGPGLADCLESYFDGDAWR